MKVIEKQWQYGSFLAYDEIDEEFLATEKGVRVLPAPFFYDKKLYFEQKKRNDKFLLLLLLLLGSMYLYFLIYIYI